MSQHQHHHHHQQPWIAPPSDTQRAKLKLNNTLTKTIQEFVPQRGNTVGWYICGPTVYDSAHIGHARAYVTFDIIRRIMEDYFHYNVNYVMNVTDIDDKIILRARQSYLYGEYLKEKSNDIETVKKDIKEHALPALQAKADKLAADEPKKEMYKGMIKTIEEALASGTATAVSLIEAAKDGLAEWLDKLKGSSLSDAKLFADLPRKYENEFFEDIKALGVRPPTVVTRVSEYVPEIIAYVDKIMGNGFAYASNGSVYFDTTNFMKTHQYAKLAPEHVSNQALLGEGEGELSCVADGEKRNERDFALWKKSKPGEPAWDSPWGKGRPGWHIECSAMASDILPHAPFDIHAGGIDLKFPHHDNELAQAEAYYDCPQWVNYFLHAGHVHIQGLKMSKSLKNFVTIGDARSHYTPRQLRMFFLSYGWDAPMDYGVAGMQAAIDKEARFKAFFHAVRENMSVISSLGNSHVQHWGKREVELHNKLFETKENVHNALCDNLDFSKALNELLAIVAEGNKYLEELSKGKTHPNGYVLKNIAIYITDIFKVFGIISDGVENDTDYGFPISDSGGAEVVDKVLMPTLKALASFREQVRAIAKENSGDPKLLLALCDDLRDKVLPELGVRLEDKPNGSTVKLEDAKTLQQEMKRAEAEKEEQKLRKQKAKEEAERAALEREELKKRSLIPADSLFKLDGRGFKAFDETGFPILDENGNPLTEERKKALEKERKDHETLVKKYAKKK